MPAAENHLPRLAWPDFLRLLAAAGIFIFHFAGEYVRNPGAPESTVSRIISPGFAIWSVSAFVVLSGFSLSIAPSWRIVGFRAFLAKRLARLYAPYWTVAVPLSLVGFAIGELPWAELWKLPIWLLGLGPISSSTYLPISQAWWYVSLALQISLIAPLLLIGCHRFGILRTSVLIIGVNAVSLVAVLAAGDEFSHLRQGFVACRLVEVMLGVLAATIVREWRAPDGRAGRPVAGYCLLLASAPLLQALHARTDALPVLVLGLVFLIAALTMPNQANEWRRLAFVASFTYTFYLVNAPVVRVVVAALVDRGFEGLALLFTASLLASLVTAFLAEVLSRRYAAGWVYAAMRAILRVKSGESRVSRSIGVES